MKIVVLDGYAANPGDLSWERLEALGECAVYSRTTDGHPAVGLPVAARESFCLTALTRFTLSRN